MSYELALPASVDSVAAGRRFVGQALTDWGLEDLCYTAMLLTSEVLTNSVLHARTDMVLTVERAGPDGVTIAVHDQSRYIPRRRQHAQDATTGRGLELLDRLAQTWEVQAEAEGKTLSFTIGGAIDPWAAYAGVNWNDVEL